MMSCRTCVQENDLSHTQHDHENAYVLLIFQPFQSPTNVTLERAAHSWSLRIDKIRKNDRLFQQPILRFIRLKDLQLENAFLPTFRSILLT